jgi:hypothetical protein
LLGILFEEVPITSNEGLKLSKELLNRIQIWRVWRQILTYTSITYKSFRPIGAN